MGDKKSSKPAKPKKGVAADKPNVAKEQMEMMRAFALHIAGSEAKTWAVVRFFEEKGLVKAEDLEGWMKRHEEEILKTQTAYYDRVVATLQRKGLV